MGKLEPLCKMPSPGASEDCQLCKLLPSGPWQVPVNKPVSHFL